MIELVARAVMLVAVCCMGARREQWAMAMAAEYDAAERDGKPLGFALGCLAGALRDLPAHEAGRFALSSYALALGLMVPIAAGLIFGVLFDFPYSYLMTAGGGLSNVPRNGMAFVHEANLAAVPSLALLILFLGLGHLRIAWSMLECDWARVETRAQANAAATVTLAIFTGLVFSCATPLLIPALGLAIELGAVALMARWYGRLA